MLADLIARAFDIDRARVDILRAMTSSLTFGQQIILQLVGPVSAAILGTLIIGGFIQFTAFRLEGKRQDRSFERDSAQAAQRLQRDLASADRAFRLDLLARISKVAYSAHYRIAHFERWVRFNQPSESARRTKLDEVESRWIEDKVSMGALQNEVDAYYNEDSQPGRQLHKVIDLALLKYLVATAASEEQLAEVRIAIAGPEHTEMSLEEFADASRVSAQYTLAVSRTLDSILITPATGGGGFRSTRLMTGSDAATLSG